MSTRSNKSVWSSPNTRYKVLLNDPSSVKINHGRNCKESENKTKVQNEDKEWKIICYADDAIVMAKNEGHLQKILHQFHTTTA